MTVNGYPNMQQGQPGCVKLRGQCNFQSNYKDCEGLAKMSKENLRVKI